MSENAPESSEPQRRETSEPPPIEVRTPVYETFEKGAETGGNETKKSRRDDE